MYPHLRFPRSRDCRSVGTFDPHYTLVSVRCFSVTVATFILRTGVKLRRTRVYRLICCPHKHVLDEVFVAHLCLCKGCLVPQLVPCPSSCAHPRSFSWPCRWALCPGCATAFDRAPQGHGPRPLPSGTLLQELSHPRAVVQQAGTVALSEVAPSRGSSSSDCVGLLPGQDLVFTCAESHIV